jgi:hypothetical protein
LFSFFICGCQHNQRKTICLYVYISDIRQIVGYRTPVFIQQFPWCLHITITYNLPHLRLRMTCWRCLSNSVNTGSCLPICSDIKTRKRRNVVGIDMIRNNRIDQHYLSLLTLSLLSIKWKTKNTTENRRGKIQHTNTWPVTFLAWYKHFSKKWVWDKLVLWVQTLPHKYMTAHIPRLVQALQ